MSWAPLELGSEGREELDKCIFRSPTRPRSRALNVGRDRRTSSGQVRGEQGHEELAEGSAGLHVCRGEVGKDLFSGDRTIRVLARGPRGRRMGFGKRGDRH